MFLGRRKSSPSSSSVGVQARASASAGVKAGIRQPDWLDIVTPTMPGDDLFLLSGGRELYEGYTVAGIDCTPGYEHMEFGNTQKEALGKAIGDIDENVVKKAQICRTIDSHLDKELRYMDRGIKVLSLFFIDEVDKYRLEDGTPGCSRTATGN